MMRKLLYSFLFFIFLHTAGFGQAASTYCFSSGNNGAYASLTGFTLAPGISTNETDDAISSTVGLPFNFVFGGVEYSQIRISNNGWFTFGSSTNSYFDNTSANASNARPVIFPLWDDLVHRNNLSPRYSYDGSPGSRIFKIEWIQQYFYGGNSGDVISFQAWLYEGSNKIEFRYRQGGTMPGGNISASIGIYDANQTSQTLNNSGSSQINTFNTNINPRPVTNQLYTFTPPTPTTQGGSDVMFCIDNTNSQQRTVSNGQYALVNVIKGYNYTFSVPDIFSGSENLILLDNSNNNLSPFVGSTGTGGTSLSWTATYSGLVRVFLSSTCGLSGSGTMSLTLNTIGNTQETQNEYGTNTWVGHIYNSTGPQPGGYPSSTTTPTTNPFITSQYAGNYAIASESINEAFVDSYTCFPVNSNGVQRASMYTETFAVRYKMKTTKTGCYLITITGDDGVRLYMNGTNVIDRWVEQGSTTYSNVLVRLDGDDDFILDYYENGGANVVGFSMVAFDPNINTITAPTTVNFCSGGDPAVIDGSLQYSSGDSNLQNPQLNFQWQLSTDGGAFADIAGATARTYDPPVTNNSTSANIVKRYKRLVTLSSSMPNLNNVKSSCTYAESNIVTITTSPGVPAQSGTITEPTNKCAGSTNNTFSISPVSLATSYTWSVTGAGWSVTSGGATTSAIITIGSGAGTVSVTATNACGTSAARTINITPTTAPSQPGTITQPTNLCAGSTGNTFSIGAVSGATSYTWSVTGTGWSVTSGGTTTSAIITIGSGAGTVSVTATNACGTSTAQTTGSIVAQTNTIIRTSAAGTDSQTVCVNSAMTNITYATTGATDANFTGLPAGVNGIWSGNVITISGTPTTVTGSPFNYLITLVGGCGTVTASGTITVNQIQTTPTVGTKTDVTCLNQGTIPLSGLPSGSWQINQTGPGSATSSFGGAGSTTTVTGLAAGTYKFTVQTATTCVSAETAPVTITDESSTEWDGSNWSHGLPDNTKSVVIKSTAGNPFPNDIEGCSLTIDVASGFVTVPTGRTLTITNAVNGNGKLLFKNGSSLIQKNASIANTTEIVYERETYVRRYDGTYWSMPVTKDHFKMVDFSPNTLADKYLLFSPSAGWVVNYGGTEDMKTGKRYGIRAPQSNDINTPELFTGVFTGTPNNGNIPVTVESGLWNLVGNPYPSAISARTFLDDNPGVGAIYLWAHQSLPVPNGSGDGKYYYTDDFTIFNSLGAAGNPYRPFLGYIAATQGFLIKAPAATTTINFNNLQRLAGNNSQFYKTAESAIERNRVWINLTNTTGTFKQILLGYATGATNAIDVNFDALSMASTNAVDFYSINSSKKMIIQGRALPFLKTDTVPLGIILTAKGEYTIAIDHADGFFNDGQDIYLQDKTTGKTTNLRLANYTFTSEAGSFNSRFVLRYTDNTLGTDDFDSLENSVLVSVKNKTVKITSSKESIKEVNIFNIGAQLMYTKNNVNSSELEISNLHSSDQALLVKITLENGHSFTKKIIYSNL